MRMREHFLLLTLMGVGYLCVVWLCLWLGAASVVEHRAGRKALFASATIVLGQIIIGVLQMAGVFPGTLIGVWIPPLLSAAVYWSATQAWFHTSFRATLGILAVAVFWLFIIGLLLIIPLSLTVLVDVLR
jgi:hypothetical protein